MLLFVSSLILTIGMFLDMSTTYIGISYFGLKEANPISRLIEKYSGILGLILFNVFVWVSLLLGNFMINVSEVSFACAVVGVFRSFIGYKNRKEWLKKCII